MFATGIENSYPVIPGPNGHKVRVDEMEKTGHYRKWREDFALVKELGLEFLRYGPPYYKTHCAPGKFDWDFADEAFADLKRLGITPIVDLCHFGVPDWAGGFQNPDWPCLFADYAETFAKRYPWIRYYTPVNEILVAATFSALNGWWNECLTSDRAFVTALTNLSRATLLAEGAILNILPTAIFIQSESSEYFHCAVPAAKGRVDFLNQRRFLALDLCYGFDVHGCMYEYLLDNGVTREEYHWFLEYGAACKPHCIMGTDYYATNEHLVSADTGSISPAGEVFGYYVICKQYFERYHLPVMHTETNLADVVRAPEWLSKQWANMIRLKEDGVPIAGFTWYSLIDQVDWDSCLREERGHANPLGLYDLDRKIRPVGEAFKQLVSNWRDILPASSVCLEMRMPTERT